MVAEILGDGKVSGLRLRDTATGSEDELPVSGMFVAIGHDPRSALVRDQVETDEKGLRAGAAPTTTLPGVFTAGAP